MEAGEVLESGGRGAPEPLTERPHQGDAALPSARRALRMATYDIHERMHQHPALSRLASGTISRSEYRHLLARSYGFYAAVEPILGLGGRLTDLLALDLIELGMETAAIEALPRCAPILVGQGSAEMTGATYVLLGASLGGKVMARAIAGQGDQAAVLPVRFLTGIDAGDWVRFAAGLEMLLPDAASQARAANAAVSMFAGYEDWMAT